MILADGIRRGERVIRQLVVLRNLPDKRSRRFPVRQSLAEKSMEYRSAGVERLKSVL